MPDEEKAKSEPIMTEEYRIRQAFKNRLKEQTTELSDLIRNGAPEIIIAHELANIIGTILALNPDCAKILTSAIPDESSNLEEVK